MAPRSRQIEQVPCARSEEEMTVLKPTLAKLNGAFTGFTRAYLSFDTTRRIGPRLQSGETGLRLQQSRPQRSGIRE